MSFPAIKSAIENLFNGGGTMYEGYQSCLEKLSNSYTQSEIDKAREDAFNAARNSTGGLWNDQTKIYTHETFQDYLNSIPK
jgi:hypothetical protein